MLLFIVLLVFLFKRAERKIFSRKNERAHWLLFHFLILFIDVQSSEDGQKVGLWMRYRNSAYAGTKLYYSTLDAVTYLDNLYPYQTGAPYGSLNIRSINDQGQLTSRLYVEGTNGNIGVGTTDSKDLLACCEW